MSWKRERPLAALGFSCCNDRTDERDTCEKWQLSFYTLLDKFLSAFRLEHFLVEMLSCVSMSHIRRVSYLGLVEGTNSCTLFFLPLLLIFCHCFFFFSFWAYTYPLTHFPEGHVSSGYWLTTQKKWYGSSSERWEADKKVKSERALRS